MRWNKIKPYEAHAYFDRALRMGEVFSPKQIFKEFLDCWRET
jgi:hypothetical protein